MAVLHPSPFIDGENSGKKNHTVAGRFIKPLVGHKKEYNYILRNNNLIHIFMNVD